MIFELLYSHEPVCYIFPNSSITSISHRGPPRALLLACRQLRDEVRDHYYSFVTFRFSVFGVLPVRSNSADSKRIIRRARKIEFMLVWNVTSKNNLMGTPSWNEGWLDEHLDMVKGDGHLVTTVIISLRDARKGAGWDRKGPLLESFRKLKGNVRFAIGEVIVGEDVEEDISTNLGRYVRELNT